ncbi:hypothetical protein EP7_005548 (plasmid) [Isosphaeraceae bacterium EP7]
MLPMADWIEDFAESQSGHLKPANYSLNVTLSKEEFLSATGAIAAYQRQKPNLVAIGHMLITLAFGAAGGAVATWMILRAGRP